MLEADQYTEYRQRIIENFDIYDLIEFLNLTVEDWLDNTSGWEDNLELQYQCGFITDEEYENAQGGIGEG